MNTIYTIEELKKLLKPIFDSAPVYKAILFGSYAKGNPEETSDIDIVIDSKGELLNINFYGVLEDVINTLNKDIDLFELSEIQTDSLIYNEVIKGVTLYEK